jgi:hypothetical protein
MAASCATLRMLLRCKVTITCMVLTINLHDVQQPQRTACRSSMAWHAGQHC